MSAQVAQSLLNAGISKPSLFIMEIPASIKNNFFGANDYLEYYCKATSIPMISHDVLVANGHNRQGVIRQIPYGVKYEKPLVITVIERSDYNMYENFQRWYMMTGRNINSNSGAQRMAYPDLYKCDIKLTKIEQGTSVITNNQDGNRIQRRNLSGSTRNMREGFREVVELTFSNAFITSIGSIQLDSETRDQFLTYDVEFYYDTYESKVLES